MVEAKKTYRDNRCSSCLIAKWRVIKKEKRGFKKESYRVIWVIFEEILQHFPKSLRWQKKTIKVYKYSKSLA